MNGILEFPRTDDLRCHIEEEEIKQTYSSEMDGVIRCVYPKHPLVPRIYTR